MTDFAGFGDSQLGQTEFAGDGADLLYEAVATASKQGIPRADEYGTYPGIAALNAPGSAASTVGFPGAPTFPVAHPGHYTKKYNIAEEWFELIHVTPVAIVLGNVISTTNVAISIFNADRFQSHFLLDVDNFAGDGITFTDLPVLPYSIPILSGLDLTLEVSTDGPPTIDGTLLFDFDLYDVSVSITGTRIVIFPFVPQAPMREFLRFKTEVIDKVDGSEQRIRMRKSPRQEFVYNMRADGTERAALQNLMFDWQGRTFGLPLWFEPMYLTAAVSIGTSLLPIDDTHYADLRVGGLVLLFTNRFTYDALPIASVTSKSITLASPTNLGFPAGTLVVPVRTAVAVPTLPAQRRILKLADTEIRFRVTDNDVDLASAAAFSALAGKVLLDDPNYVRGSLQEQFEHRLYAHDNVTGLFSHQSIWDRNRRSSQKGFRATSRKTLWEMRQLFHHLGGRLTSFYIPTFFDDLKPVAALSSGSPSLTIENVGYASFVKDRKSRIRVHLTDGTALDRTVTSSSEIDAETEQLTLNTGWPTTIQVDEVDRIEFIETVRLASDDVEIVHANAKGDAKAVVPVVEVFSE